MNKTILQKFEDFKKYAPIKAGTVAVNFFKARFEGQNWHGENPQPWAPRKTHNGRKSDDRAILVQSGRLRRSIRLSSATFERIEVGSYGVPYAKIHNEGYSDTITQNVKARTRKEHTRKAHTRKGKEIKASSVRAHTVGPYTRKLNIKMPKRQFMGQSQTLEKQILKQIKKDLDKVFK